MYLNATAIQHLGMLAQHDWQYYLPEIPTFYLLFQFEVLY